MLGFSNGFEKFLDHDEVHNAYSEITYLRRFDVFYLFFFVKKVKINKNIEFNSSALSITCPSVVGYK